MGGSGWRVRWGLSALVVGVFAGGLSPAAALPLGDESEPVDWWDDLDDFEQADVDAPPLVADDSAPVEQDNPGEVPAVELPQPGVAEVSLGDEGDAARVGSSPIEIAAGSAAVEGADLAVEVLDRDVTEPAGVSAFAMRVSGADGESLVAAAEETDAAALPVELTVDTSGWADLYGADYPSRIVVVALPDCALDDPVPAGCDRNGLPVPSHLDAETGEIVIDIDDLSALDSATLESDEAPLGLPVQVDDVSGNEAVPHEVVSSGDEPSDAASDTESDPTAVEGDAAVGSSTSTTTVPSSSTTVPTSTTASDGGPAGPAGGVQGRVDVSSSAIGTFDGVSARAEGASTTVLQPSGGSAVLALTSAPSAEGGNWGASPLEVTGDWLVGIGSGEFSWSYDIPVPSAPGGATPPVGLSYSSGSIDGLVTGRNVQAGQAGLGWSDFASSFIERRYAPCDEGEVFHDLCWRSHNAIISLNGRHSELVPVTGAGDSYGAWVLKDDPGWRVERRSAFVPNGDNNGEHWVVITPDGTQYWFGYGIDLNDETTNSAWTVPVFANNTGEPCRGAGDTLAWCNQAWRWNLDRVVDRDGNVSVYRYFKESNEYGLLNGWGDIAYNNGGRLAWIEYGLRSNDPSVPPAGKVEFKGGYRCNHLDDPTPCPVPTKDNGNYYKDVPNEFICDADCLVVSPTFFSTKRYTEVWTYMRVPGEGYPPVDVVRLNHSMASEDEGNKNLWLRTIQRIGKVGMGSSGLALPPVAFHGTALHNRVDYNLSQGKTPMEQYRVDGILDEYGRDIHVIYGRPNGCTPGTNPHPNGVWDNNELSCYPQSWRPPDASANETAVFHKWLVTQVEEHDTVGGGPAVITTYDYGSTPAWHHNDDEFLDNGKKTWSDWRGYHTARVTVGTGSTRTATRYRIYRGMHRDRTLPIGGGGFKTVDLPYLDGPEAGSKPDNEWMKGRVLEQWQIDENDDPVTKTLTEYISDKTSNWPDHEVQDQAHWVGEWKVTTSSRRQADGTFAQTRSEATYNLSTNPPGTPDYVADHMPRTVLEEGWLHQTGDERCTRTSYVHNAGAGIYALPYSQALVAGSDCTSTAAVRRNQWHYDGGALGATPTKGHVTKTRALKEGTDTWLNYTQTAYDALGRPTQVTDPNNHTTTTDYIPDVGNLTSTVVSNHLGHDLTTTYMVQRGLAVTQADANGKTTALVYDGLGRLAQVYRPGEVPFVDNASLRFGYDIDDEKDEPPVIRTRTLVDNEGPIYQDAWTVYDSFLRQRQTHRYSPEPGKVIVQSTWYDEHGRVRASAMPQAVPGTIGSGILAPPGGTHWANQSQPTYDELGRVIQDTFYGVNSGATALVQRWHTSTAYDYNATWVTPPVGGPTKTTSDAYRRVTQIDEATPSLLWVPLNPNTTKYSYNVAGDLLTVTDPAQNIITYNYDKAGRRIEQTDPDAGHWTFGYDDVGNQTSVTDARNEKIVTAYDAINRTTTRTFDAPSGTDPVLATWDYDDAGELGLLDRSTRITTSGNWVTDIDGYDDRNRVTAKTLTVPAGYPGLTGNYTTSYTYNLADQATSSTYPAAGGLPQESVEVTYNQALGLPVAMEGEDAYVNTADYDDRARPEQFMFGMHDNLPDHTLGRTWTYDTDQRLATVSNATSSGEVARHDMVYDAVGNITERTTKLGTNNFRECFTYDAYQRLTRAVTTTPATSCATNPANPSGDLPYEQDFTHTADGNLDSRDDGTGAIDYEYPAGGLGSVRPHAPTAVANANYAWNANGDLESRTAGGDTTDYIWDHERNLQAVDGPDGISTFVYDAGGQRLLRQTPEGSTLYLDGQEVTATPGGSPTVTATRLYSFAGQLIATRTAAGGVDYTVTDHQGSVEAKIDAGGTVVAAQRAYKPYGQVRSPSGTFDTQRGWIGQIEDPSTGLNYLNARYYDANLHRFISPDPLYDIGQPKSLNPYTYAWGNPATGSDPSGLLRDCECGSTGRPTGPTQPDPQPAPGTGCSPGCGVGYNGGGGNHDDDGDETVVILYNSLDGAEAPNEILVAAEYFYSGGGAQGKNAAIRMADQCNAVGMDGCDTHYLILDGSELLDGLLLSLTWEYSEDVGRARGIGTLAAGAMAICGSLPVCGEVQDGASALYHVAKGDWKAAGLDVASLAVPFASATGFRAIDAGATALRACSSFGGSTLVLMADGTSLPIADVEVGDQVLATDPETGRTGAREVIAVHPHVDQLLVLRTSAGEIDTTEDHRFWNASDGSWQESKHLDVGDNLLSAGRSEVSVDGLDWATTHTANAYDLTVTGLHSYYVGVGVGVVLVHNCGEAASIANGHAFVKHVVERGEFPGVRTPAEFETIVDDVIENAEDFKQLGGNREAYWKNGVVVITNPKDPDGGTAFAPVNGRQYFDDLT